jgi:hypothetical protein
MNLLFSLESLQEVDDDFSDAREEAFEVDGCCVFA